MSTSFWNLTSILRMFIFLAIVALGTTAVIQAAGNTKTYPGFTVFDKDGEYLKLIGKFKLRDGFSGGCRGLTTPPIYFCVHR